MTKKISDEVIAKEILTIQERDGGVCSPAAFVDAARDENSPIHSCFDWDEHRNSERWLRHQARQIISRIEITIDGTRIPAQVHCTVTNSTGKREGYFPTEVAMSDPGMRAQVFAEVSAGLNGYRARLVAFQKFQQAKSAMGHIEQAIETLKDGGESETS